MAPRKNATSAAAELSLVHLKNCLVNLPPSLVSLLLNLDTPVQNVVVELAYKAAPVAADSGGSPSPPRSVFVGWTGMSSKRRAAAPPVTRDGITGSRASRDQDLQTVEMDATLANALELSEGQHVTATIHVDPPMAHTVHIEPLTPEDWEIIELHATFLELNLQSQIRALPNPAYRHDGSGSAAVAVAPHPLTLHLSPTSTAGIKILSLDPAPPTDVAFVKLSPNAEVIVAPKTRAKASQGGMGVGVGGDHRSVASTSKSRRSGASTVRRQRAREEPRPTMFLRAIERAACRPWFDGDLLSPDISIWVDRERLLASPFRGLQYVVVDVLKPAGLQKPQAEDGTGPPTSVSASPKVVARLKPWDDPPHGQTAALSSPLCAVLGCPGIVGGLVKVQAAPPPLPKGAVQSVRVYPFAAAGGSKPNEGLKFGSDSKAEKEESAKRFRHMYSGANNTEGLLQGPITDGMVVGVYSELAAPQGWEGGFVKFEYSSEHASFQDRGRDATPWAAGLDDKSRIEFQQPQPRPPWMVAEPDVFESRPAHASLLVGIDSLLDDLAKQLAHLSSVLLTGGRGSGKTSVARRMAEKLRRETLFHTVYFSCRKLVNDETRVSTIKETLTRIFLSATWGARLGGKALVVLDDLDRLCPAETELQVGNDNGRSRQISETLRSIVREFCTRESGVVLLATAEGKDSLNNVVVSGHVVREMMELKAPDKEARRRMLEALVGQGSVSDAVSADGAAGDLDSNLSRPATSDGGDATTKDDDGDGDGAAWLHGAGIGDKATSTSAGFAIDADLDLLDVAGSTDGYMAGDLQVLVSRARNEAMMRSLAESPDAAAADGPIGLGRVDFDSALRGFTPASLRNVALQSSTTTFESIGGLGETRRVLLETLEYPTKYAPIFAQCPLRLRSGLLLYGYPGCGKTLLASAVAGECGLNFISVKGPEILNKYIGASEKSVRDLFERAQAARPCVLFFDEFDSIAPKRGHDSTGVTDRVVNQLLTQMDGAEGLSGVYVLAATSRPDLIDPALLRPGRLDKSLLCDLPGPEDRLDILRTLVRKVRLSHELERELERELGEMARRTDGFSGADLQALVSNAQLEAIHDVLDADGAHHDGQHGNRAAAAAAAAPGATTTPSFVQFRYGTGAAPAPQSRAAVVAENAAVASKLQQMTLSRKQANRGHGPGEPDGRADGKKGKGVRGEVVVAWEHLVRALDKTRASISDEERTRLARIYREFVVGRSGQMRDGQGSMEVGGRSSLM
ncbi:hypothetical protein E4U42_007212 [Claviceps africana]|uniref:Peroxisomal ATPase PEX1 n=1 Tax=Claviceps africana TaxID=83212 RepID=A0A8K0J1D7_9HYPO|nr:hypothetical protein E4U42_007212 [Claviceps africana]